MSGKSAACAIVPPAIGAQSARKVAASAARGLAAMLLDLRQVIEAPAHAEADFVRGYILDQGGPGSGVVAGEEIAEIDVAVADVHQEVGRERDADTAHDRPSEIPLGVFTSANSR